MNKVMKNKQHCHTRWCQEENKHQKGLYTVPISNLHEKLVRQALYVHLCPNYGDFGSA